MPGEGIFQDYDAVKIHFARFEDVTAVMMKAQFVCGMMPC
jgi:hypothetical protein